MPVQFMQKAVAHLYKHKTLTMKSCYVDGLGLVVKAPQSYGPALVGGEELGARCVPARGENVTKVVLFERTKDGLWFPGESIP